MLLRSRYSIINTYSDNQNNDNKQQSSSQNTNLVKCIHKKELDLKLVKLEIRKLKLLAAYESSISDRSMNFRQNNNVVYDFKKKIAAKNSKLSFKFNDTNYDF